MVDSCPTWSLAPIAYRACHTCPELQDQLGKGSLIKFNELLANAAIYHTTLDLTTCVNGLVAAGWLIDRKDLATISPYLTSKLRRFGDWKLDLTPPPAAVLGRLNLPEVPPVL